MPLLKVISFHFSSVNFSQLFPYKSKSTNTQIALVLTLKRHYTRISHMANAGSELFIQYIALCFCVGKFHRMERRRWIPIYPCSNRTSEMKFFSTVVCEYSLATSAIFFCLFSILCSSFFHLSVNNIHSL